MCASSRTDHVLLVSEKQIRGVESAQQEIFFKQPDLVVMKKQANIGCISIPSVLNLTIMLNRGLCFVVSVLC